MRRLCRGLSEQGRTATPSAEVQRIRRGTDVSETKGATESVSESENPAIPSPTPTPTRPRTNRDWWPNQPDLSVLHRNSPRSNPMGEDFDYASEFAALDVE